METDESKHRFNNNNKVDDSIPDDFDAKGYSLSGKIMLCAIVFLFFIVVLMLCLHIYARWYLLRARRRHIRRNRHRRHTQLIFYTDNATVEAASRGLDASLIASLPVFTYDAKTLPENAAECAVCLSEFELGETGRVLPKCKHAFHTECIDMWFHSHSTCPLCRAPVEPGSEEARPEVIVTVCGSEPGSSSGPCFGEVSSSSSVGLRRKPSFVGVSIEVPSRNEFRDESNCDTPSTHSSSFRSPMSRMRSFKRMISRERKGSISPSGCGCSSAVELDAESDRRDETQ